MSLRRSIALGIAALTLTGLSYSSPVRAEEGELAAQDANAQINLRSLANTQANIVAAGKVGDRIQILDHSKDKEGLVWYRVKVLRSGQLGWVRGDLIKVLGTSKTATAQKPTTKKEVAKTALKPSATPAPAKSKPPVPLTPPKPPTGSRKVSTSTNSPSPAQTEKPTVAAPQPIQDSAAPVQAVTAPSVVIVSFDTPTYAVRVFSEAGHLRLNLFNRKSQQLVLDSVPVESKNLGEQTIYSYSNNLKVTVAIPTKGTPTLTTVALGNTLQEQQETVSRPPDETDVAPKTTDEVKPVSPQK
jgi:Bacterial SH3 domain